MAVSDKKRKKHQELFCKEIHLLMPDKKKKKKKKKERKKMTAFEEYFVGQIPIKIFFLKT